MCSSKPAEPFSSLGLSYAEGDAAGSCCPIPSWPWACAALSIAGKTLQMNAPVRRSLFGPESAFFRKWDQSSPGKVRVTNAWWLSHQLHKTRIWKLPPGDVCGTQCKNSSPDVGFPWEAPRAFLPPGPLLCLGRCSHSAAQCSLRPGCVQGFQMLENPSNLCSCEENPCLAGKRLLSDIGNTLPSQVRATHASWLSHKLHQTRVWKLLPGTVYSTQGTNTSPILGGLQKATLAFCPLRTLLEVRRGRHPAAQCALGPGCVPGFHLLEDHGEGVPLWGEACLGLAMPSIPMRDKASDSPLGSLGLMALSQNTTKQEPGSFFWRTYSAQGMITSTHLGLLWKAPLSLFPPRPLLGLGQSRCLAAQSSPCTGCVHLGSVA